MIKRINHIAIVVANLDDAIATYQERIGLALSKRLVMPEQEVEIAFLPAGESIIELIQPITDSSGVAKYLASRGEGLHHICLEVDDVQVTMEELAARDVALRGDGVGLVVGSHGVLLRKRGRGGRPPA